MKKVLLASFLALFIVGQAQAGFIKVVTGADMVGLQVTAFFDDNSNESLTWGLVSAANGIPTIGSSETIRLENAKGGVAGSMFSLTQQGDSQGNYGGNNGTPNDFSDDLFYGLWTLENLSSKMLTRLIIDVMGTGVVFDSIFDDNGDGSGPAREFTAKPQPGLTTNAVYTNAIQAGLFRTLTVDLNLASGAKMDFMADTDVLNVIPEPASISIFMLSLFGLVINARRKKA